MNFIHEFKNPKILKIIDLFKDFPNLFKISTTEALSFGILHIHLKKDLSIFESKLVNKNTVLNSASYLIVDICYDYSLNEKILKNSFYLKFINKEGYKLKKYHDKNPYEYIKEYNSDILRVSRTPITTKNLDLFIEEKIPEFIKEFNKRFSLYKNNILLNKINDL